MAIDDKLSKALDHLASSGQIDVGKEVIKLAASLFPLSRALDKVMSSLAQRRLIERMVEVFQEVKSQLDEADETHVRKDYFMSDEFQTLLTLVLQEMQTTHDRTKLQMLAATLSNSCRTEFQAETRKELFIRTLRALSPDHIRMLQSLAPTRITYDDFNKMESHLSLGKFVTEEGVALEDFSNRAYDKFMNAFPLKAFPLTQSPRGEQLLLLQNLASNGLVEEMLGPQRDPAHEKMLRIWKTTTRPLPTAIRCFKLSMFGEQFLAFVSRGAI